MWQGNCNTSQSWAAQSKHTCLSVIIGTETAGTAQVPQPYCYWAQYFTCVSSISHPHVNQHRQADPQNVYVLLFPRTCAVEARSPGPRTFRCGRRCRLARDDLCGMKTFPLWLAHLQKGMSRMWGAWYRQPFKRVFFYPLIGRAINIWATGPSHGYKAYLQLSWIISRPWRWCMTFITLWDGAD